MYGLSCHTIHHSFPIKEPLRPYMFVLLDPLFELATPPVGKPPEAPVSYYEEVVTKIEWRLLKSVEDPEPIYLVDAPTCAVPPPLDPPVALTVPDPLLVVALIVAELLNVSDFFKPEPPPLVVVFFFEGVLSPLDPMPPAPTPSEPAPVEVSKVDLSPFEMTCRVLLDPDVLLEVFPPFLPPSANGPAPIFPFYHHYVCDYLPIWTFPYRAWMRSRTLSLLLPLLASFSLPPPIISLNIYITYLYLSMYQRWFHLSPLCVLSYQSLDLFFCLFLDQEQLIIALLYCFHHISVYVWKHLTQGTLHVVDYEWVGQLHVGLKVQERTRKFDSHGGDLILAHLHIGLQEMLLKETPWECVNCTLTEEDEGFAQNTAGRICQVVLDCYDELLSHGAVVLMLKDPGYAVGGCLPDLGVSTLYVLEKTR